MKSICYLPAIMAALSFLPQARAGLTTNLVAYYDFDQTGAAGLVNKAPGATGFPAVRAGTLHADWAAGASPTGPGFTGNPAFARVTAPCCTPAPR